MSRSAGPKPLEWARAARNAFDSSIEFIASEDPFTARLVVQRVENALTQIQAHPKIGRPAGALFPYRTPGTSSTIARPRAGFASCAGIAASRTCLGNPYEGARLLTSVKAVFGVDLTIQELFGKAATVAGMARAIDAARGAGGTKTATTNEKRL